MKNIHDWCISRHALVGPSHSGVALCQVRGDYRRTRDPDSLLEMRRERTNPRDRCTGYMVFERPASLHGLWLAGRAGFQWADAGPCLFLSHRSSGHGIRHPLLLGGQNDHARLPFHAGRSHARWIEAHLERCGALPSEVYIHALVRDADRQKMSKTKGNVIDPIEIVTKYGTDAVRFTLASMASPGTDIAFSESRTEGYRAFANKIWNAARFLFMQIDRAKEAGYKVSTVASGTIPELPEDTPLETRWIFGRLNAVSAEVERALKDYRFDEAAAAVYQFFWGEFCDWYLELVKLRLEFGEGTEKNATTALTLASLVAVFEAALRLLSPFMPFLTEELWHCSYEGNPPAKSIALTQYPQARDFPADEASVVAMTTLQDRLRRCEPCARSSAYPRRNRLP